MNDLKYLRARYNTKNAICGALTKHDFFIIRWRHKQSLSKYGTFPKVYSHVHVYKYIFYVWKKKNAGIS